MEDSDYKKEVQWKKDIRSFVISAKDHWKDLIGSSLVAIVLSVVATMGWNVPKTIAGIAAFCFVVVVACFLEWRGEHHKVMVLEEQRRPRITTNCGSDIPGSRAPHKAVVSLRLVVCSQSEAPIRNCSAKLVEIKKGDKTCWGDDAVLLTFAPAPQTNEPKTIHPRTTEYIDVVYVHQGGKLEPGTIPGAWYFEKSFAEVFPEPGEYLLTVQIVGEMPTEIVKLRFRWTGDWQATLEKFTPISNGAKNSDPLS